VIVGWVVHLTALVLRGLAAGRVPWADLYEFAMTGTAIMIGVFIFIQFWRDVKFLGAYITGIVVLLLGLASVNFYVPVGPLNPALQSYWLVIHVFVATLGTGFFAVGGGLSIVQLLQARREAGGLTRVPFLATFPASEALENIAYRVIVVGFAFWTFTLMAGAIWAERAWGRYWGWDTKEVWTFIIWVTFAGYIHARATRGWRGSRSAWLAIIGFTAVLFNFTVVNLFFKGLHAYTGL
jgi:cytochrome c-type biogenesis protein CcsB